VDDLEARLLELKLNELGRLWLVFGQQDGHYAGKSYAGGGTGTSAEIGVPRRWQRENFAL
jgi:hypothetical protein